MDTGSHTAARSHPRARQVLPTARPARLRGPDRARRPDGARAGRRHVVAHQGRAARGHRGVPLLALGPAPGSLGTMLGKLLTFSLKTGSLSWAQSRRARTTVATNALVRTSPLRGLTRDHLSSGGGSSTRTSPPPVSERSAPASCPSPTSRVRWSRWRASGRRRSPIPSGRRSSRSRRPSAATASTA